MSLKEGAMTKAKTAAADTIVVRLCNPIRTSLGDYSTPEVELPGDEARELLRSGLAVRVP